MADRIRLEDTTRDAGGVNAGNQTINKASQVIMAAGDTLAALPSATGHWREKLVNFSKANPLSTLLTLVLTSYALHALTRSSRR